MIPRSAWRSANHASVRSATARDTASPPAREAERRLSPAVVVSSTPRTIVTGREARSIPATSRVVRWPHSRLVLSRRFIVVPSGRMALALVAIARGLGGLALRDPVLESERVRDDATAA